MVDAVFDRLDVAVEHRGVGLEAGGVDLAGELEPAVAVAFMIADAATCRFGKDLGSAAGTRIHSRGLELFDDLFVGHLVKAGKEIKLDHRQGFEVELWEFAFKGREKIGVILEGKFAVQAADDMQLGRTFGNSRRGRCRYLPVRNACTHLPDEHACKSRRICSPRRRYSCG